MLQTTDPREMLFPRSKTDCAVGIATAGRPAVLVRILSYLTEELGWDCPILVCATCEEDLAGVGELSAFPQISVLPSSKGLPAQRNMILKSANARLLVFLDDDFVPRSDFLMAAKKIFEDPSVVGATGVVVADGAIGPGMTFEDGVRHMQEERRGQAETSTQVYNLYGCNMVIDLDVVRLNALRFDETLPLYAWLEDVDFSRQLAAYGRIVKDQSLVGVHLGTKRAGRTPGRRLGYAQIANPWYLMRKGTMSSGRALSQIGRNVAANIVRALRPEPWVDRRGRLRGNLDAMADLVTLKLHPSRMTKRS